MGDILYKEESYRIISCCLEVYNILGKVFLEVVYKDALEYEFQKNCIPYLREKPFEINYKDIVLQRKYNADFVIYDNIIIEVKHISGISNDNIKQTLNYLKASNLKLGIIANFGEGSFNSKRVVFVRIR